MNKLEKRFGDKIYWTYTHHLNSISSVNRTKKGLFVKYCPNNEMCKVIFEGNNSTSTVSVKELDNE